VPFERTVKAPSRPIDPWVVDVKPATEDTRVRREILAAAAANGFDLTSVRPVPPSLEDIYRRAVERAAHGHARDVR